MSRATGAWAGRPPAITAAGYARAKAIQCQREAARASVDQAMAALQEARRLRNSLPTDAEIGAEIGVAQKALSRALSKGIKRYEHESRVGERR